MARDPADRPTSAAALGEELRRLLDAADADTETQPAAEDSWRSHVFSRGRLALTFGAIALLAVSAGGGSWLRWRSGTTPGPTGVPVVLVLPLTNATGDSTADALGTGVADVLIASLARAPGVNVLSLAAGQQCARRRGDADCATREFGADYVLDGSLQRQARRLRMTLSLVRGPSSVVAWSESFEGDLDDLFGLQRTVAEGVAGALRLRVPHDGGGSTRRLTISERAFSDYAEALRLVERRDEPASLDQSIRLLAAVTTSEPAFALAWAGLGRAHWVKYEETKDVAEASKAETALDQALKVDPDLPGVLVARAMVLKGKGRFADAETAARRALALQPEDDEAHALLGTILASQGRTDEGLGELRRAVDLRPNYWQHYNALAIAEYRRGHLDGAAASFHRITALRPDSVWGHVNLGSVLYAKGDRWRCCPRTPASAGTSATPTRSSGAPPKRGGPTSGRWRCRRRSDVLGPTIRVCSPASPSTWPRPARSPRPGGMLNERPPWAPAPRTSPICAGDRAAALAALRHAVELGYSTEIIRQDEDLAALRPLPEFQRLTAKTGKSSQTSKETT